MFTGIIEDLGILENKSKNNIIISTKLDGIKIGDSISVNGVCLTATEIKNINKKFILNMDVMPETWSKTNLGSLKIKDEINLERALKLGDRLNGHIVQGHVEDRGKIISIAQKNNARIIKINCLKNILNNIIQKGSVSLDGISLTVLDKQSSFFSVSIIPETWNKTNLHNKKIGSLINLETDFLVKRCNQDGRLKNVLYEEGYI
jgi:riboflavin synthase